MDIPEPFNQTKNLQSIFIAHGFWKPMYLTWRKGFFKKAKTPIEPQKKFQDLEKLEDFVKYAFEEIFPQDIKSQEIWQRHLKKLEQK